MIKKIKKHIMKNGKVQIKTAGTTGATWKPFKTNTEGRLTAENKKVLPDSVFAFPAARKEPMTDPTHVRDAMARFDQVEGATEEEKDLAFSNLKKAAKHFDIRMTETDWHQFGSKQK
jgi:hypothetical protein